MFLNKAFQLLVSPNKSLLEPAGGWPPKKPQKPKYSGGYTDTLTPTKTVLPENRELNEMELHILRQKYSNPYYQP